MEIFKKAGDFKTMEVRIKQIAIEEQQDRVKGGWHSEISLKQKGWTEF